MSAIGLNAAAHSGVHMPASNPHIPVINPGRSTIEFGSSVTLVANDIMYKGYSQWFDTTGVTLYQEENIGRYSISYGTDTNTLNVSSLNPGTYNYTFCIANAESSEARGWRYNKNFCSTANVTVAPKFVFIVLTVSAPIVYIGQYETLTAYVSGGIPPYTYNFYVYNAIDTLVTSATYSNISSTSNSFTFQLLPQWGTGIFTVDSSVMDSTGQFASDPTTFTVS